jgi:hypothetical protein
MRNAAVVKANLAKARKIAALCMEDMRIGSNFVHSVTCGI